MTCEEKLRLTAEYSSRTLAFSGSVAELREKVGNYTKEEFARLQRVSDEMRVKCDRARLALEHHIAAHGC